MNTIYKDSEICEDMEQIRASGKTNMYNRQGVYDVAGELGELVVRLWICAISEMEYGAGVGEYCRVMDLDWEATP